jgi:hypothetical protein
LTANAANAVEELLLVTCRVRHDGLPYPPWYCRPHYSSKN